MRMRLVRRQEGRFMKEIEIIDARGKACPQPVIMVKDALVNHARLIVLVDDEVAVENVKRLGANAGCECVVEPVLPGGFRIQISRSGNDGQPGQREQPASCGGAVDCGPFVVVFAENRMGRGNDELGFVLIRAFLHTLCEQDLKPDAIVFYNTGVKLTVKDSEVLDDLRRLADAGVEMLVCGTCLNYFDISRDIAVGAISNMYDIVGLLSRAGRIVTP